MAKPLRGHLTPAGAQVEQRPDPTWKERINGGGGEKTQLAAARNDEYVNTTRPADIYLAYKLYTRRDTIVSRTCITFSTALARRLA